VGTRVADHVTPLNPQKLALTSPTGGGRSVGIVRVRTKATEFSLVLGLGVLYIHVLLTYVYTGKIGERSIMRVFWVTPPRSLADGCYRFGGKLSFHSTILVPLRNRHQCHCLHLPV